MLEVAGLPRLGAVEVDHVQHAGALLHPGQRRVQRVVVVDGLVGEVALDAGARPGRRGCRSPGRGSSAAPARAQIAAKFSSSRSPCGRGLLGVELHAEDGPRATARDERAPVLAAAEHVRGVGRARARTSARGRRRRRRAGRPSAASALLEARPRFQPMCGSFRPSGAAGAPRAGQQAEALGAAQLLGGVEQQLHPQADAEQRDPRLDALARASSSRPSSRRFAIAAGNAPTPGTTRPSAARSSSWSAVDRRPRAHVLERLLDRAAVAHPVVDDGDRGAAGLTSASPSCSARRSRSGRSPRPRAARARTP